MSSFSFPPTLFAFTCSVVILTNCTNLPTESERPEAAKTTNPETQFSAIKKIVEHRCAHCHSHKMPHAGLNFQDHNSLYTARPKGAFLVSGKPAESRIWMALDRPKGHASVMPGDGWGITAKTKEAFRQWIISGAQWPEGIDGQIELKKYEVEFDDYL